MPRTRDSAFAWRRGLTGEGTGLVWKHPSSRCPCTSYVSLICAICLAPRSHQLGGDEYLSRIYRVRSTREYPGNSYWYWVWVMRGGGATHTTKNSTGRVRIPPCGYSTRSAATSRGDESASVSQGVKSSINRAERSAACRAPATMWTRRQMRKRELWCVGCGTRTGRWHRRRMRVLRTWTHRCTAGRWKSRFHLRSRLLWPGY